MDGRYRKTPPRGNETHGCTSQVDVTEFQVTDHWRVADSEPIASPPVPTRLQHQEALHKILKGVNVSNIEENLLRLTSFHTRYYQTSSGLAASEWVQSVVEGYALSAAKEWDITVTPFTHSWKQNSVIVHLEDRNANTSAQQNALVILGAHLDSVNWLNPWFGRSPGADDDGSGIYSMCPC